jgi:hypothetical protein
MTINISIPDVGPNLHPQITVLGVGKLKVSIKIFKYLHIY